MRFLDRLMPRSRRGPVADSAPRAAPSIANDPGLEAIELTIVGESHRQSALEGIAGPKGFESKDQHVGVSLRCEPHNPHDANAIRVEVMGQLVAYVSRDQAALLAPRMQSACGGVMEGDGLIVGGWQHGHSDEGHYGIRVWIRVRDADRLGIRPDLLDSRLRSRWPELRPARSNERRVSPSPQDTEAGLYGSTLTVTCEEHYQPTIAGSMPLGCDPDRAWPLLVELVPASANPHTAHGAPCVEIKLDGGGTIGYLTPKMSERHMDMIRACVGSGHRVTAEATATRGTKGGEVLWRVKIAIVGR